MSSSLPPASSAHKADSLMECQKILTYFRNHKDADPFLEPVKWKEWGLLDYPKVIKHPMDLGQIQQKMDRGDYSSPLEFERDMNLVWNNCMTYNLDGSEYFVLAQNLKKLFEEKFSKIKIDSKELDMDTRQPTLADKKGFSQNIYLISSEDLGKLVQILDSRCDACISKIDPDDIEIDIDSIDPVTFWVVDQFVRDCITAKKRMKKARTG